MMEFTALRRRDYNQTKLLDQRFREPLPHKGPWIDNWFSNFKRIGAPVTYRGRRTDYVEIAYVAAKNPDALVCYNSLSRNHSYTHYPFLDLIFEIGNPAIAKRLGRPRARGGLVELREQFNCLNIAAMDYFLRQRWRPELECTQRLLREVCNVHNEYVEGNTIIELNNWRDNRFGVTVKDWIGRNALGLLLHLICREILTTGQLAYGSPEEQWIHYQPSLIAQLNAIKDGGVLLDD